MILQHNLLFSRNLHILIRTYRLTLQTVSLIYDSLLFRLKESENST